MTYIPAVLTQKRLSDDDILNTLSEVLTSNTLPNALAICGDFVTVTADQANALDKIRDEMAIRKEHKTEKFKAGRELTFHEIVDYLKIKNSLLGLQHHIEGFGWSDVLVSSESDPEDGPYLINPFLKYRVKPKSMIRVNGELVAAPESITPKNGAHYWFADSTNELPHMKTWYGKDIDYLLLRKGIVYLNKADAQARLDAMLKYEVVE